MRHSFRFIVGLPQVEIADDEGEDNSSEACDARVPRRRNHGVLPWIVDTSNDNIFCPCVPLRDILHLLHSYHGIGAASFTIYSRTKENFRENNILCRDSIIDVSLTGGVSGAMSGALISFGSARMCYHSLPHPPVDWSLIQRLSLSKFVLQDLFLWRMTFINWYCPGTQTARIHHCCKQGCYYGQASRDCGSCKGYLSD